jgi:hypothetical protein
MVQRRILFGVKDDYDVLMAESGTFVGGTRSDLPP